MRDSERLRHEVNQQVAVLEALVLEGNATHVTYGIKRGSRSLAELIARLAEAEDDEETG